VDEPSVIRTGTALTWKFVDQVAVKLVFLLRLLVLARILAPEDFGLLAIALATVALFTTLTEFGIYPALIQQRDPTDDDYHTAWTLGVMRAAAVTLAIVVAAPWIANFFGDSRAGPIAQTLAIGIAVDSLISIRMAIFNRVLDFKSIAILNSSRALTSTIVAISLAASMGVWAMVVGTLAGSAIAVIGSYLLGPVRPSFRLNTKSALGLFRFGRWIFLAAMLAIVANFGLRAIISRELGVAALGLFYLALRIATLPTQAIVDVFTPVGFSAYARLQDSYREARDFFRTSLKAMLATLIPACILLAAAAGGLVQHILGAQWEAVTEVIQLLLLGAVLGVIGDACTPLLKGFGRPDQVAGLEFVQTITMLSLAWLLAPHFGLLGVVAGLIGGTLLTQLPSMFLVKRLLPTPFVGMVKPASFVFSIAALSGLAIWGIDSSAQGLFSLCAGVIVGAAIFLVLIQLVDVRLKLGLIDALIELFPRIEILFVLRRLKGSPSGYE
jgi:PST family polysaccharide transporter/lipopolysaccharide exporter